MIVYRLNKSYYSEKLTGDGAAKSGGRWNNKGIIIIYTAQSRALCMVEIAVHTPIGIIPKEYVLMSIQLPDSSIYVQELKSLPSNWKSFPHIAGTKQLGDSFINDARYLILKVPSAVVQGEFNYLINPKHKDFNKVKIISVQPFDFDQRLFTK